MRNTASACSACGAESPERCTLLMHGNFLPAGCSVVRPGLHLLRRAGRPENWVYVDLSGERELGVGSSACEQRTDLPTGFGPSRSLGRGEARACMGDVGKDLHLQLATAKTILLMGQEKQCA